MRNLMFFVMILCSGSSWASGVGTRDLLQLLEEARELTGYHKRIPLPKIVFLSTTDLQREYCKGTGCDVSAFQRSGTVFLNDQIRLDNVIDRSIIVHEFVHYIQRIRVGDTYTCKMWYEKEMEAYKLQAEYLKKYSVSDAPIRNVIPKLKCPE